MVFGAGEEDVFFSINYGQTWSSLSAPLIPEHQEFNKIIVFDNTLFTTTYAKFSANAKLFKVDLSFLPNLTGSWTDIIDNFITSPDTLFFADFSNKVDGRFYLQLQIRTPLANSNRIYKSTDSGDNFSLTPINIRGGMRLKNELIASINDANCFYWGTLSHMKKYNEITGDSVKIDSHPSNNGHHVDYRSSHIINDNGKDRLSFGNDGGPALVKNGLDSSPLIESLNGDLSIKLIHAFHLHEPSKRIVYAFQDHKMRYRDPGNIYSNEFIHEGSAAMIQDRFPLGVVGENTYSYIKDAGFSTNPIVEYNFADNRLSLGSYFLNYRHFPERFAKGINLGNGVNNGGVALNRGKNISEVSEILTSQSIGAVAICERDPNYIYAAEFNIRGIQLDGIHKLYRSSDDGASWTSLFNSTVTLNNGTHNLSNQLMWNGIRAIAVDHTDPSLVYCGIGGTHEVNNIITGERFRVIKSTDFGNTFIDFSEGLPALPVERLLTVESDEDLIFCATSVGVYYRMDGMSQWECFSENLPMVEITGIQFDYCSKELLVSTYGRGMWKTPVPFEISSSYQNEITGSEEWNNSRVLKEDLVIKGGGILTIKSIVQVAYDKKILIEPGGKLILDGGVLTNYCDDYWQGIQVYGTSNQHQFPAHNPTHQGMLELKNGGTIEYAHKAVTNWKEGSWNEIGGVIKSTDGVFRNNRRGVEFMAYQNFHPSNSSIKRDNTSRFTDTDFLTDDDFIEGYPQQPYATLWKVKGIQFINCHFSNNVTTNKSTSSSPNEGISSLDASFSVVPRCADNTIPIGQPCPSASVLRSSFSNLEFAVQVAGAGTSDAVTVSQADFTNNVWGIYVDEFDNVNLNRNDFSIGNGGYSSSIYFGNGITLDNATGFVVEENTVLNTLVNGKSSGIVVNNSEDADNRVYKNTLTNLFDGTRADNVNRKSDLSLHTGLQFLCNDYVNNRTAISVNYPLEENGIRINQGEFEPRKSAGNTFQNNNMDIVNNTFSSFNYYHSGGNTQPINISGPGQVLPVPNAPVNTCPTRFTYGIGVVMLDHLTTELANYETDLASHKTTYDVLKYNHISLIDNGNTDVLQSQIENNWSSDAWTLRNNLMQEAPYLSTEALLTAAGENILPNAMLLEVLLANPDATKGEQFIFELNEVTNNTLPEYMLNYVRNNWNTETVRTTLEGEMMAYQSKIATATNFIKYLKKSKEEYTYSERHNTVLMGEGISNKIGVMDFFIENNEWLKADSVLQAINSDESMQGDIGLIEDFDNYITFRSSLGSRNIAQLDAAEVQYLETLAEKGSRASGYAENILCFFYDICYEKELPEGGGMAKMLTIPAPSADEPSLEELMYNITVYPNPANEFTSIKWEIYDELKDAQYKIFDMNGREMGSGSIEENTGEKVIDTRGLENGVYIINIYNEGNMKMNSKLIVDQEK